MLQARGTERGTAPFEPRAVLRGRITRQLSPGEMLQAIDETWFAE